jgi:hypothetical protein
MNLFAVPDTVATCAIYLDIPALRNLKSASRACRIGVHAVMRLRRKNMREQGEPVFTRNVCQRSGLRYFMPVDTGDLFAPLVITNGDVLVGRDDFLHVVCGTTSIVETSIFAETLRAHAFDEKSGHLIVLSKFSWALVDMEKPRSVRIANFTGEDLDDESEESVSSMGLAALYDNMLVAMYGKGAHFYDSTGEVASAIAFSAEEDDFVIERGCVAWQGRFGVFLCTDLSGEIELSTLGVIDLAEAVKCTRGWVANETKPIGASLSHMFSVVRCNYSNAREMRLLMQLQYMERVLLVPTKAPNSYALVVIPAREFMRFVGFPVCCFELNPGGDVHWGNWHHVAVPPDVNFLDDSVYIAVENNALVIRTGKNTRSVHEDDTEVLWTLNFE